MNFETSKSSKNSKASLDKRETQWINHEGRLSSHYNLRKTPIELWIPFWWRYPQLRMRTDQQFIDNLNKKTKFDKKGYQFLSIQVDKHKVPWTCYSYLEMLVQQGIKNVMLCIFPNMWETLSTSTLYTCRTALFLSLKEAMIEKPH